jgi:hypothetical protein
MVNWTDSPLDVQDGNHNKKSAAGDAQQQLVPHPGQGPAEGPGRPIHKGKKKGEVQVPLPTHGDWGVDATAVAAPAPAAIANTAAALDAAPTADSAAAADTVAPGSFLGENLKGAESMRHYQHQYQFQQSPPSLSLTDLIDDEAMEIKRNVDVQFLMDFAIIGHPKCGTTFLLRKLSCRPGKRASCRDRPEPYRWYKPCTRYNNYLWPHRSH